MTKVKKMQFVGWVVQHRGTTRCKWMPFVTHVTKMFALNEYKDLYLSDFEAEESAGLARCIKVFGEK